jgi:uncharacterized damage-inducible protein DinB
MDDAERLRCIEILHTTPEKLRVALARVPKKLLAWAPAPGKWSILEIVCHMRDMEREAYLARYRRILAEDTPSLADLDGDAISLERDYRSQRLAEVVRDWKALRKETLKALRAARGAALERAGVHEGVGRLTIADYLHRHAHGNDEAHLGQIEAIKRRFAILARLEAAPTRLAEAVKGLSDEALRKRPPSGKWSILENVCHLRDFERLASERYTKIAFSERPKLWMMNNDRVAEALKYAEADAGAVVKEFKRRRGETLALLRALPDAAWRRTGIHPKRGELTIEQLATLLADHDENHIGKIRAFGGSAISA